MNKSGIATIIIMMIFSYHAMNAQVSETSTAGRSVYAEIFGNGLIMSFSYDQRLTRRPDGIGVRIGVGGMAMGDVTNITVPFALNYLAGNNGKYFEAGIGATYSNEGLWGIEDPAVPIVGTLTFGYRRQPVDGGFMWRIGLSPVFGSHNSPEGKQPYFLPYFPHLGLGYTF